MQKKIFLLAAAAVLALAGCKTGFNAQATLSQLSAPEPVKTDSFFYTEVPSCDDYQTKLESKSLLEAKQKVPFVLPGVKYLTCKTGKKTFKSFAQFSAQTDVGGDVRKCAPDSICVGRTGSAIEFTIGKGIRQRLDQIKESLLGFDASAVQIRLYLVNDSVSKIKINFVSGFYEANDGTFIPQHDDVLELDPKLQVTMIPSNAAVAKAFEGQIVKLADVQ